MMTSGRDLTAQEGSTIGGRHTALVGAAVGAALLLGGTAQLAGGALALTDSLTVVSWVSTTVSGKGLGEHALNLVTGRDCRFLEAALRDDRRLCERRGSPATEDDFRGLAGLLEPREQAPVQDVAVVPGEGVTSGNESQPTAVAVLDEDPPARRSALAALDDDPLPRRSALAALDDPRLRPVEELWPQAR